MFEDSHNKTIECQDLLYLEGNYENLKNVIKINILDSLKNKK